MSTQTHPLTLFTQPETRKVWCGVDPGISGSIAILEESRAEAFPLSRTERDINDYLESWSKQIAFAILEDVASFPGQGVVSTFTFGQSFGFVRALLIAHKIPFAAVKPQAWQKALGIQPRKSEGRGKDKVWLESPADFKRRLKSTAQELFPKVRVTAAIGDALLLSEFCRRMKTNG